MGINASFGTGDEKDDDDSLGSRRDRSPPPAPRSQPQTQPQPAKKPEPEPEPVQVEEPVDPKIAESLKLKEEGNAFYKKKKLTEALDCYERAIALDGTNVSIINNKGATLFELGRFEDCIATCEQAVEVGREQYADFKLIAKALARVGGAYAKLEKFEEAINAYKRSLSEHRTAETLDKLKKVEKQRDVQIKEAYRNPELADKAREEGNVAFKAGDFSKAVGLYTEAIKRNDKDAKPYTNRATAYSKLLAYPEALRDCEKAIELDPAYARAYIRKATIEYSLKEYNKALTTLKEARSIAKEDALKNEIDREEQKVYNAINAQNSSDMTPEQREEAMKRAGRDPEIQAILRDPGMQSILQRMQEDPAAAQAYLRDPKVMDNIQKLVAAGVLRLG
ncbi:TPR-like protein [Ramicandelaber brevisporus]|nr:TPR-like protein [Ramicandelaber brevisporus]